MGKSDHQSFWRRRQTVVDRGFQWRFALQLFAVQTIVLLCFQALFQMRLETQVEAAVSNETFQALKSVSSMSLQTLLITSVITGGLLTLVGLWFSNRIIGPLPRLQVGLAALAAGDYSKRLTFRPGDYLSRLAEDYNRTAEALQQRYPGSVGGDVRGHGRADASFHVESSLEEEPLTPVV